MKFDISGISCPASVRLPFLHRRTLRSTAALVTLTATAITFGLAPRAHAGHWAVSFSGSSSGYNENLTFVNNTPPANNGSHGAPAVAFNSILQGEQVINSITPPNYGLYQMAVQATLTWTPDNPHATSSPPSSVTVLETGFAQASQLDPGTGNKLMQATDALPSASLLDPAIFDNYQASGYFRMGYVQSNGSYVNVAVPAGAQSITLPQRNFSVGALVSPGTPTGPYGSPGGELSYAVSVDTTPEIVITASPTSGPLGGTATTTVTVQSTDLQAQ